MSTILGNQFPFLYACPSCLHPLSNSWDECPNPFCAAKIGVSHMADSEPTGWQPIETEPKDGTFFLGYEDGNIAKMYWLKTYGYFLCEDLLWSDESGASSPTHWMPLPEEPK